MRSYSQIPNPQIGPAYLAHGDYNLISLDWSYLAALNYIDSQPLAPWVGFQCAEFVRFLAQDIGLKTEELLLIGHSLGAHVAGFCGRELQRITNGELRLGYIVALDAALPLYAFVKPIDRVSIFDADYVMAVHTNGLIKGALLPLGHADFYVHGGQLQPGCGIDLYGSCSHARVAYLYAEAVMQKSSFAPYGLCRNYAELMVGFGSCPRHPNDQVRLGDPLEVGRAFGIITFGTNPSPPFGRLLEP